MSGFSHASFRLPDGCLVLTCNLHLKIKAGGAPQSRHPDTTFDFVLSKGLEVARVEVPATFDAYNNHRPVVVDFRVDS